MGFDSPRAHCVVINAAETIEKKGPIDRWSCRPKYAANCSRSSPTLLAPGNAAVARSSRDHARPHAKSTHTTPRESPRAGGGGGGGDT